MSQPIVELFEPERMKKLEQRRKIVKYLLWALGLAAAAACVVLTLGVNNQNIYRRLIACICISVGTAWVLVYFGVYSVKDPGREIRYAANLAGEPRECVEGRVKLIKLKIRLRKSVTLRKVLVETQSGPVNLTVLISKAEQLRRAGEYLKLYTAHGYIVAYEVTEHEDP